MKATIFLEKPDCGNYLANLAQELSQIKDIYDVLPDQKASKISFHYKSEVAALEVVGILHVFRSLKRKKSISQPLKNCIN